MLGAWRVEFTEVELGWGPRPDGYAYSLNRNALEEYSNLRQSYQQKGYRFDATPSEFVPITDEFNKELMDKVIWTTGIGKHSGDMTKM